MNKLKFLIAIIIMCSNYCLAQTKSNYRCSYSLKMVKDSLSNTHFRDEVYVVQVGDGITKGFAYSKFFRDSLKNNDPKKLQKMRSELLTQSLKEMKSGGKRTLGESPINEGAFDSYTYKNYKKEEVTVFESIAGEEFVYNDKLTDQEWNITTDTMSVLGYVSQKATCEFRGRQFEAWFTTEIPISEGPWKFYGLPGLITKIYDTQNHYCFELIGFQKSNDVIEEKSTKNSRKIDRIKFLKGVNSGELTEKINKSNAMMIGFGSGGKQAKNMYETIETDYK